MTFNTVQGEQVLLRRFDESDVASFLAYRNGAEVARYQSWESFTEFEARHYIQEQSGAEPGKQGQWFQFAIAANESGRLIGDCGLKIDAQDCLQGEIGFTLAREVQGQGFAKEAVSLMLDYAFGTLNLHRLVAITDCRNAASVALLERLQFRREGHFLQNIWFKGEWGDEYLYAMLKDDWLNISSNLDDKRE